VWSAPHRSPDWLSYYLSFARESRSGATSLLRAQADVGIQPVPALGPCLYEGAPHRRGVAGKGELEIDGFLAAALRFIDVRRMGMCGDELLPRGRGAGLPRLLKDRLLVFPRSGTRQRIACGVAYGRSRRMRFGEPLQGIAIALRFLRVH